MKKVIYNSGRGAYESPCCEILSVQAEGAVLIVSGGVNYSLSSGTVSGTDTYDDGDDF